MKNAILTTTLMLTWACSLAQVQVDEPVVLEGATPADRRVEGLSNATEEGDALNARALQAGAYRYAVASGADNWSVVLDPALSALTAGMKLHVKAPADNTGPVTIDVNALGTWYVVKNGSQPLEAADLAEGEVATLLFDGTVFHLLGARRLERRPCPSGFVQVNELYCIEPAEHDTLGFYDAAAVCSALNATLCTWGQWYAACTKATDLGLSDMIGNWEWTGSAANANQGVRVVGQSVCFHAGATSGLDFTRNFRCCFRR